MKQHTYANITLLVCAYDLNTIVPDRWHFYHFYSSWPSGTESCLSKRYRSQRPTRKERFLKNIVTAIDIDEIDEIDWQLNARIHFVSQRESAGPGLPAAGTLTLCLDIRTWLPLPQMPRRRWNSKQLTLILLCCFFVMYSHAKLLPPKKTARGHTNAATVSRRFSATAASEEQNGRTASDYLVNDLPGLPADGASIRQYAGYITVNPAGTFVAESIACISSLPMP